MIEAQWLGALTHLLLLVLITLTQTFCSNKTLPYGHAILTLLTCFVKLQYFYHLSLLWVLMWWKWPILHADRFIMLLSQDEKVLDTLNPDICWKLFTMINNMFIWCRAKFQQYWLSLCFHAVQMSDWMRLKCFEKKSFGNVNYSKRPRVPYKMSLWLKHL